MIKLTYHRSAAGGRVVHALQGGGEGLKDAEGRLRYCAEYTCCGVEKRSRVALALTDDQPTCKACLAVLKRRGW